MKIMCLGAAGKISRESVYDLVAYSDFEKITVADFNEDAGREVVRWLDDPRVDFVRVDVNDHRSTVARMREYDLVMDGTTISLNDRSTACIAAAGVHGINLNGCGAEWEFDGRFSDNAKIHVPGMGMTPGITNLMAMHAASQLETVDTIRISHGAFRPVAFSPSIAETTRVEYDPELSSRVVYEKGAFIRVPPFARPLEIELKQGRKRLAPCELYSLSLHSIEVIRGPSPTIIWQAPSIDPPVQIAQEHALPTRPAGRANRDSCGVRRVCAFRLADFKKV